MKKLDLSGIASPPPKFEARPPRPEPVPLEYPVEVGKEFVIRREQAGQASYMRVAVDGTVYMDDWLITNVSDSLLESRLIYFGKRKEPIFRTAVRLLQREIDRRKGGVVETLPEKKPEVEAFFIRQDRSTVNLITVRPDGTAYIDGWLITEASESTLRERYSYFNKQEGKQWRTAARIVEKELKRRAASKSDFEIPPLRFTKGQEPEFNWRPLSYYDDRAINSFFDYYYSKVGNAENEVERAKWGPSLAALMNEQDRRKRESARSEPERPGGDESLPLSADELADNMQKASEAFTAMGRAMGKSSIGNDMVDTLRGYYGVSAGSGIAIDGEGLRMAYPEPEPEQTSKDELAVAIGGRRKQYEQAVRALELATLRGDEVRAGVMGSVLDKLAVDLDSLEKQRDSRDKTKSAEVYEGDLKEMILQEKARLYRAKLKHSDAADEGDEDEMSRLLVVIKEAQFRVASLEKQQSARDLRDKRKKKGVFDF
jgi:hypothetical protein